MKILLCIFLLACFSCAAQSFGPFTLTGSQCATIAIGTQATVGIYAAGSWTGALQSGVSVDGKPAGNLQVTPAASSTAQSTIAGAGGFFARVAGYSLFQICGSAITGTATLYLNVSPFAH